jgi:hypothetical protein
MTVYINKERARWKCAACDRARSRAWKLKHPEQVREMRLRYQQTLRARELGNARNRRWYRKHHPLPSVQSQALDARAEAARDRGKLTILRAIRRARLRAARTSRNQSLI